MRKVNVASLNMVKDTTCCADKDVNSSSELSGLVVHWDTTIDRQCVELTCVVLKSTKLILNLQK